MEKSTSDKNGIKWHEVASEFLTLISFQYLWYEDESLWEKNKAGVNPLPMASTFSQQQTKWVHFRAHFHEDYMKWRSINNVMFSRMFSLQKAEFDLFTAKPKASETGADLDSCIYSTCNSLPI